MAAIRAKTEQLQSRAPTLTRVMETLKDTAILQPSACATPMARAASAISRTKDTPSGTLQPTDPLLFASTLQPGKITPMV